MRILVLSYEYPPVGGGGGRAAMDISEGLASCGHQVLVITSHLKGLSRQEEINGVKVVRVVAGRRMAFKATVFDMAGYIVSAIWRAIWLIPRWKPDLIHVHFAVPTGPVAWVLAHLFRLPYVLTAHLGDVPGGVPEKTEGWFRWVYPFTPPIWKSAAQVVAVSEFTRSLALQHYLVDMRVIPNGVDLQNLDPGEIIPGKPPQIVFAGRFVPQKNLVHLVCVLAGITDLSWKCVIIGDGPQRPDIESEIARQQLDKRIEITGWITPDQVLERYAQSDILFMPSLSEGFPLTGVQALAMGLAIVASQVGGFLDLVIPGENGFLCEPNDLQGMQVALRSLLSDSDLLSEMRCKSRERSKYFDLSVVVADYEKIFEDVISRKSS